MKIFKILLIIALTGLTQLLFGQNVGIGTNTPAALLQVNGLGTGEGNVLFTGTYKLSNPGNPAATGAGTRMMWYPDKAAFRAGRVGGSQWDIGNIGSFSSAWGENTTASGTFATAYGNSTIASGFGATAWGHTTIASSLYATAWGFTTHSSNDFATAWGYNSTASAAMATAWGINTTASGERATAWGSNSSATSYSATAWGSSTLASGVFSTAMGVGTRANSYASTAIGRYNVGGGNAGAWNNGDPLFEIGNGANENNRNNALVILKNGKTGILTATPATTLHINHTNAPAGPMPDQGLRIQNTSGVNRLWTLYTFSSNGALALYSGTGDGVSVGNFNAGNGAYTATSNRHLKTNVLLLGADVLTKIQQLQPATYSYLRDPMQQRTVGFMAEDVQPIFPELVDTVGENGEHLAINYAGFSVVAIKAIQELTLQVAELKRELDQMKKIHRNE